MFTSRMAQADDFEFLFELKKAAEYLPIKAVFGWDETIQREIHQQEWDEVKPTIIEVNHQRVGSYLVQYHEDHIYFGRFFLLPEMQGKGIGSAILKHVIEEAKQLELPTKLVYLQGNRVGELYARMGFEITSQDHQFVRMTKAN